MGHVRRKKTLMPLVHRGRPLPADRWHLGTDACLALDDSALPNYRECLCDVRHRYLGGSRARVPHRAREDHPPRPPLDGICDLQAFMADCSWGELAPGPPETCTSLPENFGSGKSGTPWERM